MRLGSLLAATGIATLLVDCGPTSRRDLGSIPQREITYDDLCHLQDFFDARGPAAGAPYHEVQETETEAERVVPDEGDRRPRRVVVGEGTYDVTERGARARLLRLIEEEYDRLPALHPPTDNTSAIRLHVGWWQSGTIRRLIPDRDVDVTMGAQHLSLPFNPCVGEFLFGTEAYATRRRVLNAEAERARGQLPVEYLDGGGPSAPMGSSGGEATTAPVDAATAVTTDATATGG